MTLNEAYNFLNFWINKKLGLWYPPDELDMAVDRGSIALYNSLYAKYGTSTRVNNALNTFKQTYQFTNVTSPGGIVTIPDVYMNFIDAYVQYVDTGGHVRYKAVPIVNEDEKAGRMDSQVIPMTVDNPFAEMIGNGIIQLYPKTAQAGYVTYFRRPAKPYYAYTLMSGRVIVYNGPASTQLDWPETMITSVMAKAMESIGINMTEDMIIQWTDQRNNMNLNTLNKL